MVDGIEFTNIPGSGVVAPIFTVEFNSGGQYTSVDRIILIGTKWFGGAMDLYTPMPVSSQQQADAAAGHNSLLREMARIAFQNAPALPVWIMAVSVGGLVQQVQTITVGTVGPGVGVFVIMGETMQVAVSPTDTPTTIASNIQAAINGYYNGVTGAMLPCLVTGTALGVVTLGSTHPGVLGAELDIYVPNSAGNVFAASGAFTVAITTAGSGTPADLNTALAALGDTPADFVVCPWSDSVSLGDCSAWSNDVSGRWAWTRQSYGHVWTAARANYSGLTTLGLGLNDRHLSVLGCVAPGAGGTPIPSYLWMTAAAARLFPWLTDITYGKISAAHKGLSLQGILPPRDPSVWPNFTSRNVLNSSGISTFEVMSDGTVVLSKIITTYQTGVSGQPDAVFRDVQSVYQCAEGFKYIRAGWATLFSQKSLADSNPGNLGTMVTPVDIKAGTIGLHYDLCVGGVFQDNATFAQLLDVEINANNPNRVDLLMPIERVNPLDILAANATIYQQYPNLALSSFTPALVAA